MPAAPIPYACIIRWSETEEAPPVKPQSANGRRPPLVFRLLVTRSAWTEYHITSEWVSLPISRTREERELAQFGPSRWLSTHFLWDGATSAAGLGRGPQPSPSAMSPFGEPPMTQGGMLTIKHGVGRRDLLVPSGGHQILPDAGGVRVCPPVSSHPEKVDASLETLLGSWLTLAQPAYA
ncbi:hypothetical protein CDD83_7560 [Cordyceps sp. RAO-2017]|nr:hypothetical protein CDD83_7560 [Cordyceps sp. RAO-2017]